MNDVTLKKISVACGGFLLGVLWMDLLFDMQIVRAAPEPAVATIATYYRHATTVAYPMNRLIGGVMVVTLAALLYRLVRRGNARRTAALALLLAGTPIALAAVRVFPNAVRLGLQADPLAEQLGLARAICFDHVLCLVLIAAFVAIEIVASEPAPTR
jgi:hypothetical protein